MAEFQKTMAQWRRMCKMFSCGKCPLNEICTSDTEIARIEETVIQWAEENPAPVYPTLYEWLRSIGLANHRMIDPIPADIAQKLGVKPKESNNG